MSTAALLTLLLLLAAGIVFYVLAPLLSRSAAQPRASAEPVARAVLRERRRELDASLAHLAPDSPERLAALAELAAQVEAEMPAPAGSIPADTMSSAAARKSTGWALALAALLLIPPAGLYWLAGAPQGLSDTAASANESASVEQLMVQLRERLERDPNQPDGWLLLGRTELAMGRPREARAALERALALSPSDPQTKADLADAMAQEQGASLNGRPIELIREALAGDPKNPKALALAGAFEVTQGNAAGALAHWKTLLTVLPADSPQAQQISEFVANLEAGRPPGVGPPSAGQATATASSPPARPQTPDATPPTAQEASPAAAAAAPGGPANAAAALQGRVELDPALATRLSPGATLFVVARSLDSQGNPAGPPLAVIRARATDLPLSFTLDDRQAMSPMARLSTLPAGTRVAVVARVSQSGEAGVKPGDLQGRSAAVQPGASGLVVRIDQVAD